MKRNSAINFVMKLGLNACIYHLWIERNSRMHAGVPKNACEVASSILLDIRGRILGVPRLRKIFPESRFQLAVL